MGDRDDLFVKDLLDAHDRSEGRINTYWNFYLIVVVTCVGWLVSRTTAIVDGRGYSRFSMKTLFGSST